MITISCRGIRKYYVNAERFEALKGINLDIYKGQLTLLVGPSGSGKTTLLSIINTILTPDAGDLYILGHHINEMNELEKAHFRSKNMGVIFQALYLIPTLSVIDNIALPLIILGESEQKAKVKAAEILKQINLLDRANYPPTHLSRGQQQLVAIGRALINDADIIMCDEPTSALDQVSGGKFMALLREHALHSSRTVFVVTHDHRIFSFADRIVKISDGLIEEEAHA